MAILLETSEHDALFGRIDGEVIALVIGLIVGCGRVVKEEDDAVDRPSLGIGAFDGAFDLDAAIVVERR